MRTIVLLLLAGLLLLIILDSASFSMTTARGPGLLDSIGNLGNSLGGAFGGVFGGR